METEQISGICSNRRSQNRRLNRRSWHRRALALFASVPAVTASSGLQAFSEKDWLYFHYQREPEQLAAMLGKLRALPQRLSQFCGQKMTVSPVHVIIFADRDSYFRHLEKTLPQAPRRSSLFVVRGGRATILVADNESLERDLLHESVHAINFATFGKKRFPLWLDEGMAEWFEADERQQAGVHGELIAGIMGDQRDALAVPLKLSSLERIGAATQADALSYAASWAWCRFLGDRSTPCHRVWVRFLEDLQAGVAAGKLSHRLTLAVPDYEALFLKSLSLKTVTK